MEEKKVTEYMLPQNITAKFEFIRGTGIGIKEAFKIAIGLIIGVVFFALLSIPTELTEQTNIFGEVMGTAPTPTVPLMIRLIAVAIPTFIQVFRYSNVGNNKTGGYIIKVLLRFYTENRYYKYKKGSQF